MNAWQFTGNLGGNAETRVTPSGDPVVSFSVGVKSGFGDRETTTWARCQMWGKRGEAVAPYLTKGQLVGISGEVSLREWNDKEGQKRSTLEVRVNDLTLLGKRDVQQESPRKQQSAPQRQAPHQSGGEFGNFDDIPFMRFAHNHWRAI